MPGPTPAPTGTGGDTPTARTTTGEATATCGRETPRLSLRPMLRPTPRLTGTETGTAGGGEAGDTDTGPTAMDTTAAGGVGRYPSTLQLKSSSIFPAHLSL